MEPIMIGGRLFAPVINSTIEHDFMLMGHIRAARLDQFPMLEGEPPGDFAVRLLAQVIDSGRIFDVLGCMLIPAEVKAEDWTPAIGKQAGEFIRTLTASADKALIQGLVVELLVDFFKKGLFSLTISRKFSEETETGTARAGVNVETLITETGPSLSAN